ncbi:MAG: hypothetical protein U0234_09620 [Sandaracinus sp.]
MTRPLLVLSCLALLAACGSSSTSEAPPPPATPTPTPVASVAPSSAVPPPSSAPPTSAAPPPLPGHLWVAQTFVEAQSDAELSSPPEGISLEVDQPRFGTEEELAAPPQIALTASRPLDAPSPVAEILAYASRVHASAGEGCHLGVGRSLAEIVEDTPRTFDYRLVSLCPVPALDGVQPDLYASAAGEDLSAGEIGGVTLMLDFHRSLADVLTEDRVLALDAPGVDFVLVQTPSSDDPTRSLVEMHADEVDRPSAATTLAAFAGRPMTIEGP